MNITTERWSRSICFLLGMGIIVRDHDAHFRSYLVRKPDQEAIVGLGDENALRDPSKQSELEETRRKSRMKKPARVSETKMDWETREGRKWNHRRIRLHMI